MTEMKIEDGPTAQEADGLFALFLYEKAKVSKEFTLLMTPGCSRVLARPSQMDTAKSGSEIHQNFHPDDE